jgi:hypothetical protein
MKITNYAISVTVAVLVLLAASARTWIVAAE